MSLPEVTERKPRPVDTGSSESTRNIRARHTDPRCRTLCSSRKTARRSMVRRWPPSVPICISYLTESVGSKGCIGLTDDNAKALFDWAPVGTLVVVISEEE